MKIADTSAQDVAVQEKPKGRQRLMIVAGLLGLAHEHAVSDAELDDELNMRSPVSALRLGRYS